MNKFCNTISSVIRIDFEGKPSFTENEELTIKGGILLDTYCTKSAWELMTRTTVYLLIGSFGIKSESGFMKLIDGVTEIRAQQLHPLQNLLKTITDNKITVGAHKSSGDQTCLSDRLKSALEKQMQAKDVISSPLGKWGVSDWAAHEEVLRHLKFCLTYVKMLCNDIDDKFWLRIEQSDLRKHISDFLEFFHTKAKGLGTPGQIFLYKYLHCEENLDKANELIGFDTGYKELDNVDERDIKAGLPLVFGYVRHGKGKSVKLLSQNRPIHRPYKTYSVLLNNTRIKESDSLIGCALSQLLHLNKVAIDEQLSYHSSSVFRSHENFYKINVDITPAFKCPDIFP
jgi:hypothetical protein